jgi:hypothetical protein
MVKKGRQKEVSLVLGSRVDKRIFVEIIKMSILNNDKGSSVDTCRNPSDGSGLDA